MKFSSSSTRKDDWEFVDRIDQHRHNAAYDGWMKGIVFGILIGIVIGIAIAKPCFYMYNKCTKYQQLPTSPRISVHLGAPPDYNASQGPQCQNNI